jgi:hypothetical protein
MMSADEYAVKALEMDAKASTCLEPTATALYRQLALEWWRLRDDAIWQDRPENSGESLDARTSRDLIDFDRVRGDRVETAAGLTCVLLPAFRKIGE